MTESFAAAILGLCGIVIAAVIKFVPQRRAPDMAQHSNGKPPNDINARLARCEVDIRDLRDWKHNTNDIVQRLLTESELRREKLLRPDE